MLKSQMQKKIKIDKVYRLDSSATDALSNDRLRTLIAVIWLLEIRDDWSWTLGWTVFESLIVHRFGYSERNMKLKKQRNRSNTKASQSFRPVQVLKEFEVQPIIQQRFGFQHTFFLLRLRRTPNGNLFNSLTGCFGFFCKWTLGHRKKTDRWTRADTIGQRVKKKKLANQTDRGLSLKKRWRL